MFPKDEAAFGIDNQLIQYYIGSSGLLAKPVTEKGEKESSVYPAEDQVRPFTHTPTITSSPSGLLRLLHPPCLPRLLQWRLHHCPCGSAQDSAPRAWRLHRTDSWAPTTFLAVDEARPIHTARRTWHRRKCSRWTAPRRWRNVCEWVREHSMARAHCGQGLLVEPGDRQVHGRLTARQGGGVCIVYNTFHCNNYYIVYNLYVLPRGLPV